MTLNELKNEKLIPEYDLDHIRRHVDDGYAVNATGNIIALRLRKTNIASLLLDTDALDLEYLYLSGNQDLKKIEFKFGLPKLKLLYADNIGISEIDFPKGFDALQQIYLQKNQELSKVVFQDDCPSLILMDLVDNTQLTELTIKKVFSKMEYLYLKGSALLNIPKEITETDTNCWIKLRDYLNDDAQDFLHEAKMILIGNGYVGKSSIRIKLKDVNAVLPERKENDADDDENRTPGLHTVIETYDIPIDNQLNSRIGGEKTFKLKIWDFGGQGKYREVQSLFCSRKSLYVFVTSPNDIVKNQNYVGYPYWLSMANAFSDLSPIIHVMNKIDLEGEKYVEQSTIKKYFENISSFEAISCKKIKDYSTHFDKFKSSIRNSLSNISVDIFSNQYSVNWLAVKKNLEDKAAAGVPHITKEEYLNECYENKMNESQAETWLSVLDSIGTVLYFSKNLEDHSELKDFVVLNPNWVSDAICKVLDATNIIKDAKFYRDQFPLVWNAYNTTEHKKLLAFLLAYKLCYPQKKHGKDFYIIPSLIKNEKQPEAEQLSPYDCTIRFIYEPFIPAGTVNKLIVALYPNIYEELIWKNGVVLNDRKINTTYAELTENWEEKYIELKLKGANVGAMYDLISEKLKSLNEELKNAKLMRHLDFSVKAIHNNKPKEIENLQELARLKDKEASKLEFLWRKIGHGNEFKIIKKMGIKEIQMEKFRKFIPFAEIEGTIKVLFLASGTLNTGLESRFKDIIRYFGVKQKWDCKEEHGLDREKFRAFVINQKPNILHYGGHGEEEGIILEESELEIDAFERLMKSAKNTQCIILNACNTNSIAEKLAKHIPYVIGTQAPVDDRTAISFAHGFYSGIVADESIEDSFNLGINEIIDKKLPGENVYVLFKGVEKIVETQ